jgi:hypothetical protein
MFWKISVKIGRFLSFLKKVYENCFIVAINFSPNSKNEPLQNFLRIQIFCSNLFAIMCIRKSILNKIGNVGGGWGENSAAANQPFWC